MSTQSKNIDLDNAIILIRQVVEQLLEPVSQDITAQEVEDANDTNADRLNGALGRLGFDRWAK